MGKKEWTPQEIQLLESIKLSNKQKNWKMISKLLAKKGFKRSQQECRHKWVNCLSPQINHGPWSDEELSTLYLQYEKNLSRWSVIQKFLPNRTQIKIKNHFYGILRNIVRFVLKHYHKVPGKQTEISNKINPNSLKSLFWGEGEYEFLQNEIKNVITLMKYRFNKQKLFKIISEKQKIYKKLNEKILEEANINLKPIALKENKQISSKNQDIQDSNERQNQNPALMKDQGQYERARGEQEIEMTQTWSPYTYWPGMYLPAWQFDNTLNMHYMVYLTGSDLNNYNRWTFDVNL